MRYDLTRIFGKAFTAFFSRLGGLLDGLGISVTVSKAMSAIVLLEIWTVIAVMILSGGLLLDFKKKKSRVCYFAMCTAVSLAVLEIVMSVVCFPITLVFSFVNVLYIIYGLIAIFHIRKRKCRLCRIASVALIVIVLLNLIAGGLMINSIAG